MTARTEMEVHTAHNLLLEYLSLPDARADYTLNKVNRVVLLLHEKDILMNYKQIFAVLLCLIKI